MGGALFQRPEMERSSDEPVSCRKTENFQIDVVKSRRQMYELGCWESFQARASHIHHVSSAYIVFYTLMIVLNTVVVFGVLRDEDGPEKTRTMFLSVEIFIAVVLVFEVGVRLTALGLRRYFKSCFNVFDMCVAVACVFAVLFFSFGRTSLEEADDLVTFALVALRYCLPLCRLLGWIHAKANRPNSATSDTIVFDQPYDVVSTIDDEELVI